tara:strand:+ start:36 stop:245 length:210 start_codon:yes stop_codon:yes gene_type:complete
MANARDLNFEVIEQLLEAGISAKDLLDNLVLADDAYNINTSLAFIVRVSDYSELLNSETEKELDRYDKQ